MKRLLTVPDTETLTRGVNAALRSAGGGPVNVIHREPHRDSSTFPLEVLTCRLETGESLKLLCKYSAGIERGCYGHRGGVVHEAEVYRQVLQPCGLSVPKFHGSYRDWASGGSWLLIEFMERAETADTEGGMVRSAVWLGRFHAAHDAMLQRAPRLPLRTYDEAYYLGWARRTLEFVGLPARELPWLPRLCDRFTEIAAALLERPPTVIHGEFYPLNILIEDGLVYPVDWEAAALAAGEIDLASLTQGWPAGIVQECEHQYKQARWPGGAPAGFETALDAARVYWLFRWLGDNPRRTEKRFRRRIDQLRSAAERWNLI